MSLRREFIALAHEANLSVTELARRFGVSRKTAYKWLQRDRDGQGLSDRSRRPRHCPTQTTSAMEEQVVALRRKHPCWGGRKLFHVLCEQGHDGVPAPSTITHILRRRGLLDEAMPGAGPRRWQRFEHAAPNDLWQMDFKGTFAVGNGRCDPLTVLDDHSRYNVLLKATSDMRTDTVQAALTETFQRYGLPWRMNMDNGSPWGSPAGDSRGLSKLSLWLVRLGIQVTFSAPAHPQTNGKDERFHRSLKAEVLTGQHFPNCDHAQQAFDQWRAVYNHLRPHEALGMAVPGSRYQASPRPFPAALPPIEYGPNDQVAMVKALGVVRLVGRKLKVSNALAGYPIAARPREGEDGVYDLFFAHHRLTTIDLRRSE